MKKLALLLTALICAPIALTAAWSAAMGWPDSWYTADWASAGIAPNPKHDREAIIQVYSARAGRWKGAFSVHTWIAVKSGNAPAFDLRGGRLGCAGAEEWLSRGRQLVRQ